jgi:hypothetical protein
MSLIGTSLTPKQIKNTIIKLKELAKNCHASSIAAYPKSDYQSLDSMGVQYQKHILTLENILAQWQVESNYTVYKNESSYFKNRANQLEEFYVRASDNDKKDIIKTISLLQEKYLERLSLCEQIWQTAFPIEISKDLELLINKI